MLSPLAPDRSATATDSERLLGSPDPQHTTAGLLSPIHMLSSPGADGDGSMMTPQVRRRGQVLARMSSLPIGQLYVYPPASLRSQVRHIMHDDNPAGGLRKSRRLAAVVLPLMMIFLTMLIEKHEVTDAAVKTQPQDGRDANAKTQRLSNLALLNRTCAPRMLLSHALSRSQQGRPRVPADAAESQRVLVGAGFPASGLPGLSSIIQHLPGACTPARVSLGFWTTLGAGAAGTHSSAGR